MELTIKDLTNKDVGKIALPVQFAEPVRIDLIKKAVEAFWANNRQAYGADPEAGKRYSAKLSRRRHNYRGSYGYGISRVPRKILSRRGMRMYWVAAFAPGTVGGRRAHPPKAEKIWEKKINVKERRKAIRAAMAATVQKDLVIQRGHHVPEGYPFVVQDALEQIEKTKEFLTVLKTLGYEKELQRTAERKIRAGKGKARGRRYKQKKGILVVVGDQCPLLRQTNIPGVDVVPVTHLHIHHLAPGAMPGRVTLWTEHALKVLQEKQLYQ